MGSLVWVLNLWSLRIAAGAAVLAAMAAAPVYKIAFAARDKVAVAVEHQKAEQAEIWKGL